MTDCNLRAKPCLGSRRWRKQTANIVLEKMGVSFLQLLILGKVWSQIVICHHATISHVNFSRFGPLKIKISDKNLWHHNPLGIVNHIGFLNVNKLIIGWKIGTKKIIVCKNAKYFIITSPGFAQFRNLISYTLAFIFFWHSNQSPEFSFVAILYILSITLKHNSPSYKYKASLFNM